MMRRNDFRALRTLSTALTILGLLWLLFSGIQANLATKSVRATVSFPSMKASEQTKSFAKGREEAAFWDPNINYVSKRRVPSGPDPIHNRRAVIYRQPPGA